MHFNERFNVIKLTVFYPEQEFAHAEVLVFSAEYVAEFKARRTIEDLTDALAQVEEALSDIDGILDVEVGSGDPVCLTVAHDPSEAPWISWYLIAIEAIRTYYAEKYTSRSEIIVEVQSASTL